MVASTGAISATFLTNSIKMPPPLDDRLGKFAPQAKFSSLTANNFARIQPQNTYVMQVPTPQSVKSEEKAPEIATYA